MSGFTIISQTMFGIQFILAGLLTIHQYGIYKQQQLPVQKYLLGFLFVIATGGLFGVFFITSDDVFFNIVSSFGSLTLALLLMTALVIYNIKRFNLVIVTIFVVDLLVNLIYGLTKDQYISNAIYRSVTGTISLIFVIPAILIFIHLAYKTRDVSLSFFSLGLILYTIGGIGSQNELIFAGSFLLANLAFFIGILLPKLFKELGFDKEESITLAHGSIALK